MTSEFDHILPGRKHARKHLGRVLILGLGKSGRAAFRYCYDLLGTRVESLSVAAGERTPQSQEFIAQFDPERFTVDFDRYDFPETYDVCIASPGIPQCSDFYRNALYACDELIGEVEFAWRESAKDSRWIAITGTNGKTTTTALTAHLLQEAHMAAAAVGNIGETCLEAVAGGAVEVYVAEVSSYQLASTKYFAPDVSVILNITPDHTGWHGSHERYREAKLKVLDNLSTHENPWAILDATDEEVRGVIKAITSLNRAQRGYDYIPMGTAKGIASDMRQACGSENAAFVSSGHLRVALQGHEHLLSPVDDLQIQGAHNYANALAASAVSCILGIEDSLISSSLTRFGPLSHRMEPCGSVAGIVCYNDSKATNTDAAQKALTAFTDVKPLFLLGGFDKGTDLSSFVKEMESGASAVVCFGGAGPRFYEAFRDASIPVYHADTLEDAFDTALDHAQEGDAIVLSPACASFDEFSSFEARGDAFKDLVKRRSREQGA